MILKSSITFLLSLAISTSYGFPRSTQTGGKIVGGRDALPGEFPYKVSLRTLGNSFYCGGVIIAQSWTLTAAHCVDGQAQNGILVVAGTIFLNAGGVGHQSLRYIIHPQYDDWTLEYDVAVIENQVPFVFNNLVSPIPLNPNNIGAGLIGVIAGWGGTGPTGPPWPNTLQALNVTTLTNPDCRARHTEENAYFVFDQKICTYNLAGQGVCFGDSGGSVVVGGQAIAIVSWGVGDCGGGWPDVFIRISYVYNWISQAIIS